MASTPVSLNDESLNGSWIDINSASQIHSPVDDDSPELTRPPYSLAESVQNLGLISFQVERFLQEAQRSSNTTNTNNNNNSQPNTTNGNSEQASQQAPICDNISDLYLSDSDISVEGLQESKALINNLRKHHLRRQQQQSQQCNNNYNINTDNSQSFLKNMSADLLSQKLSKSGDCLLDQVSDSLSLLSRASLFGEQAANFEDFDWLWDWTAQPEYFTGQEWKVSGPKQEYLVRQRQLYCQKLSNDAHDRLFSGEMMSLLVLTNLISIILGAGLTYSILMRKSSV